ncbi:MAG TPA: lysophospholipid acyltransferase family protein [Mycobacteriales bacterium]|jgi:1-acyl-sn-glycerol-3-phosphate acyltransferase|nr:lysophospholipid acyltransferase family protein [Mycobacteriales bacterium]
MKLPSINVSMNVSVRAELTGAQKAGGTPWMRAARGIGQGLILVLTRMEVVGLENLPMTGSVLLAANHTHNIDGPLLFGLVPRPTAFFVKAEAFIGPIKPFLLHIGQIPIRRGTVERAPLAAALDTLAAGGSVGIFPEGSRGRGDVAKVEHGIAYLAVRSGAPVVPIACAGTNEVLQRRSLRRPKVRVLIGPPVQVPAGAASRQAVADAAEQIREALAKLVMEIGSVDRL